MRKAWSGLSLAAVLVLALCAACPAAAGQASAPGMVSLYKLVAAPDAAFVWYPALPRVNQPVTLVSTSNDLTSPIAAIGWDVTDFGVFAGGGPAITTTFATPASHVVRMRVASADGLSSVAAETIQMSPPAFNVMNPFPIVKILGIDFSYGTKIRSLSVQALAHDRVMVECHGSGCPVRSVTQSVPARRHGASVVAFRRFERLLRPGTSLKVRVSNGTEIGAYTRFTVRRRGLPERVDSCLNPAGTHPTVCPS